MLVCSEVCTQQILPTPLYFSTNEHPTSSIRLASLAPPEAYGNKASHTDESTLKEHGEENDDSKLSSEARVLLSVKLENASSLAKIEEWSNWLTTDAPPNARVTLEGVSDEMKLNTYKVARG
jgi:hypothetical protein